MRRSLIGGEGVAAAVLLLAATVSAQPFLVDTGEPTSSAALVVGTSTIPADPGQVLALEFVFTSPASVTAIYPHLGRLEEGLNLGIWLTTEIGPSASSADLIGQWTIWGIPGSESYAGMWYPIELSTPLYLQAGSYYLTYIVGTDEHAVVRWGAPIDHGRDFWAAGNWAFPPGSSFNETARNMALRIEGTPIPEPSTLLLLGTGLLGLLGITLEQRKRSRQ